LIPDEVDRNPADNFIDYKNLLHEYHTDFEVGLKLVYFSFTSLATVGFGDFHPRSDYERALMAFILLGGVAVFSYIMGVFIGILNEAKRIGEEIDDGDNLSKFFGLLK